MPLVVGAGILLAAASLRLPIGSIAPVLPELQEGVGLSSGGAGVLTTLPVLCFGLAASLAPPLARRWGDEFVVLGCLLALVTGIVARIVPELLPLFGGTLLLGVAIAVANVLLPSVIKRRYERPGTMMGLYTMILTGSAALAAGLTVPLEQALGSWQRALAAWALPVLGASVVWLASIDRSAGAGTAAAPVRLWSDRTAWMVSGFMGFQSLLFYVLISWTPDLLRDSGLSAGRAGLMLSICMIFGLPGSLLAPMFAARLRHQRGLVVLAVVPWTLGFAGLLAAPAEGALAWMILLGLGQGIGFGLSLSFIVLRAPDGAHAAALSGMVQSVGYGLAAIGPFAVGWLHDLTDGWDAGIALLLVVTACELATGLGAGRARMVGARARAGAD